MGDCIIGLISGRGAEAGCVPRVSEPSMNGGCEFSSYDAVLYDDSGVPISQRSGLVPGVLPIRVIRYRLQRYDI